MNTAKTPGQAAYEEDVRRCPRYQDGASRPRWDQLDRLGQKSWEDNPTPRDWDHQSGEAY